MFLEIFSRINNQQMKTLIIGGVEAFEDKGNEIELKLHNGKSILTDAVVFAIGVRDKKEFDNGAIPNSINMNVDTLRENFDFFNKNKKYVIYYLVGLRGYLAQRILRN